MIRLERAALCLDCDTLNEMPTHEDWRFRAQCDACCSRSLIPLTDYLGANTHTTLKPEEAL